MPTLLCRWAGARASPWPSADRRGGPPLPETGMLGSRYGSVPSEYVTDGEARFDWLREYPSGRSVTELEFVYGALEAQRISGRPVRPAGGRHG